MEVEHESESRGQILPLADRKVNEFPDEIYDLANEEIRIIEEATSDGIPDKIWPASGSKTVIDSVLAGLLSRVVSCGSIRKKEMRKWLKRKGNQVFNKSRKLSKEVFLSVVEILVLENRVEKEAALSFLGTLAALTWSTGIGVVVKLLFFPPPSWLDVRILAIASLGVAFGLFIALESLQECNAWLIPEGETKSPYVLFLPSAAILVLGATMVFVVPLAFVSAFLLSYKLPVALGDTDLSPSFIQLFYIVYSLRFTFLIIQKAASLVMKKRCNLATNVNKTRILKYFLLLTTTVVFLFLSKQKILQHFVFTFTSSLLVWGFVCMAWWEKADKRDWGWGQASLVSIVSLVVISSLIYGFTYLLWQITKS